MPGTQPENAFDTAPDPAYSNHAIHLVRTAQQMTLTLSQMADTKASMLMGATFVVFTIAVGQAKDGHLATPLAVLALFAFVSALCAVFAVLPAVSAPEANRLHGKPNLLFFGTYSALDEDAWTQAVLTELRADEAVFRTMLHDIYQNGLVLQRKKYRFLGFAYRIFVAGLCLTVATFLVERFLA
ncbi:Pycsar system effector family protein [Novosphingobium huizhouense]|uniref:Pycsar system effector family protein n=1 Tax=Novosphingobium huizhouense TaxID=2866625 RepID=UPI001CD8693D|nr:Pycsar system effector family protein [Novosphingobium huizhouense]